jgi:serine protease AprX
MWLRIIAVMVACLLIGAFGAQVTAGAPQSAEAVTIDPDLPVHPLLQYGAQVEPDKKVTIVVQKTSRNVKSADLAKSAGAQIDEEFPFIHSVVMTVPQKVALVLGRQKGVQYVTPDAKVRHLSIDTSHLLTNYAAAIGVTDVWNGNPVAATGRGVTIAVLDSGVNPSHPDLGYGVTALLGNGRATRLNDPNGHGTHVVGIITGRDALGRYIGVAPDAKVISLKIADDEGLSREVDLIRGLQWVYANRTKYNIRVVNLSVSGSVPTSYKTSPIAAAAEQLWFAGVLVVTAAGNRGPGDTTAWYPPSNDPYVLSVGALDHNETLDLSDDSIAPFSTRGSTQDGYYRPDIVAPGRRIVSTLSSTDCTLARLFPDRIENGNYLRLSGTSMAAPVAAGVAALVLEKYPALTPNQLKWLLINSARPYAGMPDSAGIIDPAQALLRAAQGNLGSANQGLTPSQSISSSTMTTQWAQSYWDQSYWDQSYWDQSYWDSASGYDADASYDMTDID